ncbi:MAG TPA: ankyrin repeat domain-containing protein [Mycobacteriales bacterium]|nr:ankyrin repeat domain-containing protein [Mycobacteriales bacterium]
MTDGEWTPAHLAVEQEDLVALREALDAGADIHEEDYDGCSTLLHHAIDIELDSHVQSGDPLHVDLTAYLLARGADPRRRLSNGGASAAEKAAQEGHWLAQALIEEWLRSHPQ